MQRKNKQLIFYNKRKRQAKKHIVENYLPTQITRVGGSKHISLYKNSDSLAPHILYK